MLGTSLYSLYINICLMLGLLQRLCLRTMKASCARPIHCDYTPWKVATPESHRMTSHHRKRPILMVWGARVRLAGYFVLLRRRRAHVKTEEVLDGVEDALPGPMVLRRVVLFRAVDALDALLLEEIRARRAGARGRMEPFLTRCHRAA